MVWNGYVERHRIDDRGRKAEGATARLATTPEIVLRSPVEVADWITRQATIEAKSADADGQVKNGLMIRNEGSYQGAAARGGSAYTTVHLSRTEVVDVCAEVTEDDDAPIGRRGLSS